MSGKTPYGKFDVDICKEVRNVDISETFLTESRCSAYPPLFVGNVHAFQESLNVREREGKEFEELFPHLGRVCVLKSPFNRGAVTDDDDSILSVLRQMEPGGTRRGKEAEPPLKFGEEGMCRHRPSNLYTSSLNRTFIEPARQLKRGEGTEDDIQTGIDVFGLN